MLRGQKGKYRALATDINLKGRMDGWEVAKHAREIDPGFPVIYMTGASADQWAANGVPNSILLTKPFAPAQLVTAVSQLLNSGTPTALLIAPCSRLCRQSLQSEWAFRPDAGTTSECLGLIR